MGEIYRARRRGSKELVAVKLLHIEASDDDTTRKRFLREAACQEQLDHPNIVRFHASGETDGLLYLVMEQVTGQDLHRFVAQHGPMPPERVTRLARQLLDAINFAHVRGVIHRDIKPANILLSADGERLKITDFGLALALSGSRLTLMNQMGGTPQFMAPEQAEDFASASFEADQYAAAAVLYFLLTGQAVFENAPPHAALNLIRTGTPIPLRQPCPVVLPEPLGAVIRRGLKRYTNERFPDARAMRDALGPA